MPLSNAAKEAYANSNQLVLYTLELRHSGFSEPIRIVRDRVNLKARLESSAPQNPRQTVEFIALAFDLKLPTINKNTLPELTLKLDNIYLETQDKRISDYIAMTIGSLDPVEITCRTYAPHKTGFAYYPIDQPFHLILHDVVADSFSVSAKARFFNPQNSIFPRNTYTLEEFPSLNYG